MKTKLHELTDTVRVESHPPRKRATATEALLSDTVTARHYKEGAADAKGNPIKLGEPMDFIDWYDRNHDWTVYQKKITTEIDKDGKKVKVARFLPVSTHDTEAAALSAASVLIAGG